MLIHNFLQPRQFIFGNQYIKHVRLLVCICPRAFQPRNTAVELLEYLVFQFYVILFRNYPDFHIDILGMLMIYRKRTDCRIDEGVNDCPHIKQEQTYPVQDSVCYQIDLADAQILFPF